MIAFLKRIPEKLGYVYAMRKKVKLFFLEKGFLETLRLGIRFLRYGRNGIFYKNSTEAYQAWIKYAEKNISKEGMVQVIQTWDYLPLVSIVTPVYNVDPQWLDACVQSVMDQAYPHWELCLYDDASTNQETITCLEKWSQTDSRIKVSYGKQNLHISGASNKAIELATGEFVALLDNDDAITPNALFEVVNCLQINKDLDFIYSDEDKFNEQGVRVDPFFKPDWSLHLFLSMMYVCHMVVFRRSILNSIGGFRKGFEGSQDYDLVLRFIEKTEVSRIAHIPKILYHWRKIPGSAAAAIDAKSYAYIAAEKAIQEYVDRNKLNAQVMPGKNISFYRTKYSIPVKPLVSIIIPFRDQKEVLGTCIKSILHLTKYSNYEILLVNNQSADETGRYVKNLVEKNGNIHMMEYNQEFNFSDMNNKAVEQARGEYVIFLNNDTEITQTDWIECMLEYAQQESVGAVGCRLVYPNGAIQHAGVIVGLGGIAAHPFIGQRGGAYGFPEVVREYSAVTAACMMIRKKLFQDIGGFDVKNLGTAYNDVDLCLRLREAGYLIIYTPFTEIIHHESASRGNDNDEAILRKDPARRKRVDDERLFIAKKWPDVVARDPYYNDNLAKDRVDYMVKII